MLGNQIYKQYKEIRQLSDTTYEVMKDNDIKIVKVLSFPSNQSDVFTLLMQNMGFDEMDEYYKKESKIYTDLLDRINYLESSSNVYKPIEYIVEKINGGTGWNVKILKEKYITLSDYMKCHRLKKEESLHIIIQVLNALTDGLKSGYYHGNVHPTNIYLTPYDEYKLDDFGIHRYALEEGVKKDIEDVLKLMDLLQIEHIQTMYSNPYEILKEMEEQYEL